MSKYCNCSKSSNCGCNGSGEPAFIPNDSYTNSQSLIENDGCGKGYCRSDAGQGLDDCNGPVGEIETIPEKLIFMLDWYDKGPDLVKRYTLIFYLEDGMCEIKDLINNQRFLRKLTLDTVTFCVLYLGNVLNIYGRQMTITDYADSCTKQFMERRNQRAFMLIKPEAVQCLGKILQIVDQQFRILRARMVQMTPSMAASFFKHYKTEEFYSGMVEGLCSGPSVALLLVGANAVQKLLCLAGETDPGIARLKHPQSLRAIYGKDFVSNGIYVTESPACVSQDISYFFTECRLLVPRLAPGTAQFDCSTCCIIKPHAVKAGLSGQIISDITRANYKVTAFELFYLDRTHAEEFYEIYKTVLPEYSNMTAELALGPCYVMEISGCGRETAESFREFAGPMVPVWDGFKAEIKSLAKKLRPESLRAKYGKSLVQNAVHCTDLADDAEMEVDYFFRILQIVVG